MPFLYIVGLFGLIFCSWKHGLSFLLQNRFIDDVLGKSGIGDLTLVFLILFCIGYIFLLRNKKLDSKFFVRMAFLLPIFASFSLPIFSSDFFAYFEFSRIFLGYKLNPYLHGYAEIHDVYSSFAWFGRTTNYGPLAHFVVLPSAALSFVSIYFGFIGLKLTWLALGLIVLQQLKKLLPVYWFMIFALNPFWIIEVFINGHNDIIAVLLIVLTLKSLIKNNENRASLYLALISLFKLPLGIFSLFFTLHFLKIKNWSAAGRLIAYNLISIFILLLCLEGPTGIQIYLQGSAPYTFLSFFGHIITVIQNFILHDPDGKSSFILATIVGLKPFSFVLILCLSYYFFISDTQKKNKSLGAGLCVFIYLIATQFWPWYALWILPIIAITEDLNLLYFFFICSFSSLIIYTPGYWLSLEAQSTLSLYEFYKIGIILIPVLGFLFGIWTYIKKELQNTI